MDISTHVIAELGADRWRSKRRRNTATIAATKPLASFACATRPRWLLRLCNESRVVVVPQGG